MSKKYNFKVGQKFVAQIGDLVVDGKIQIEGNYVYLYQNYEEGLEPNDKLGYKYAWYIGQIEDLNLIDNNVTNLMLEDSDPATYKDWQVGDMLKCYEDVVEVIFRSGKLVILENYDGTASDNFTCDELFDLGYRLIIEKEPEIIELTSDEALEIIAKVKNVDVNTLRIKK